ncbi:MAG: hypothetical protein ACLQVJ_16400 [Syntrophobacteraceae bacterium]
MTEPQNNHSFIVRRELLGREFLTVMILTIVLIGLALAIPAGYNDAAPDSPALSEIKAPWLIIWLQVLLRHFPPLIAGFAMPMAALIIVACLPWIPHFGGHDPLKQYQFGFHQIIFIAMASVLVYLTFWGL